MTNHTFDTKRYRRWVGTFIGFPLAGIAARLAAGNIDDASAAAVGGLVGGAVLGAVQAGVVRLPAGERGRWIGGTAVGLAVGLTAGASAVGFDTDPASLATMGAISGLAVGLGQAGAMAAPASRFDRIAWALATPLLWAIGWLITSQVIVDADRQHAVFGSSGALVASLVAGVLFAVRQRPTEATEATEATDATEPVARLAATSDRVAA